jgi:hypothetical protein
MQQSTRERLAIIIEDLWFDDPTKYSKTEQNDMIEAIVDDLIETFSEERLR